MISVPLIYIKYTSSFHSLHLFFSSCVIGLLLVDMHITRLVLLKTHLFLSLIKFKNANPLNTYNYYLIDYKNIKETLKHRLSVLQSYSLIPVFLLVANNLTSCSINNLSFQNLDIKSIIDSNSTNIVLIFILLFYLYILVSTLRNYEKICHTISLLERYIFELNHPGISLEKKPDILIKSDKHSDSLQQ